MSDKTIANLQSLTRATLNGLAGYLLTRPENWAKELSAALVVFAASWTISDNNTKAVSPVVVPSTTSTVTGVKLMALAAVLFLFTGCARFVGQTETKADGTSITRFRAYTLFDSKNDLTKLSIKQTTTNKLNQSFGILGVDQQSQTSTNFNALVSDIVGAAIKAAVKP